MITKESIVYETCELEKLLEGFKAKHEYMQIAYSMRDMLAKKNANQLWGSGYKFESNNENIVKQFSEFAQHNKLPYLLKFIERELSLNGRVIVCLNKNKGGQIKLNIANPFFYAAIGKVFVNENLAVLWQRVFLDNGTWYIKSIYDREKCVNEIYSSQNKMLIYGEETKILQELQLEKVWRHNLGFVPVVQLTNYPIFEYSNIIFSPSFYESVSDWYNAAFLEKSFYTLFKDLNKEANYCHSRIAVEEANQQFIDEIKRNNGELALGDYIIQTEVGSKVQAIPGVGDFTKYTNAMNEIMDFYCKFANSSRFSDGGGAQKTSAEASSSNSSQIETIYAKKSHREYELTDLFAKVLAAMGLVEYWSNDYDFNFSINVNIDRNDNAFLDSVIKKIQAGLMSIPQGLSDLYGIPLDKAETMFENIKEFNEKNNVMVSTMMSENEMDGFASDGFDKGGRPESGDVND